MRVRFLHILNCCEASQQRVRGYELYPKLLRNGCDLAYHYAFLGHDGALVADRFVQFEVNG